LRPLEVASKKMSVRAALRPSHFEVLRAWLDGW